MNLITGLLQDPYFNMGTNILAQQRGGLGAYGRGVQQSIAQQQQQAQQEQLKKLNELKMLQVQRGLMTPQQRQTVQGADGNPYFLDGTPVLPNAPQKPADNPVSKLINARNKYPIGSPERNYFDKAIKKANYIAPQHETMVKVQTPNGVKYVPQSQAEGMNAPITKGMQLTTNPDGSVSFSMGGSSNLTKANRTDVQKKYRSALETINNLNTVADKYSKDYLTVQGMAKSVAGSALDSFGVGGDLVDFNAQRQSFRNEVSQMFNQYRNIITGSAAGEKEMKDLKDSIINADLPPKEFMAAYNQFIDKAKRNLNLNARLDGVNPDELMQQAGVKTPKEFVPTTTDTEPGSGTIDEEYLRSQGLLNDH